MVVFFAYNNSTLPDKIQFRKPPDSPQQVDICDRIIGSLVGLAVSDALGASVEFRPRQYLVANPIRKMEGGGTWGLDAGKWTDDTSMALCLASSLIIQEGFNPYDQMVRYKCWFKQGYLSSTGNCFDIGKATRQALIDFSTRQKTLKTRYRCRNDMEVDALALDSVQRVSSFQIECGSQESAGNGALMRLAPVPLFYYKRPDLAVDYAGRSTSLTHANRKAIDASRYYAALIIEALNGKPKEELLSKDFVSKHKSWFSEEPLDADIQTVAQGSFKKKNGYDDGIRGKGYVVNALEAALWAFWSDENSFEKGALLAVNLGDDTDTTAAIYGQLAGAYYGYKKIPPDWRSKLYAHDFVVCIAEWLHFLGTQYASENNLTKEDPSEINQKKKDKFNSHPTVPFKKQLSTNHQSTAKPVFNRSTSVDSSSNTSTNVIVSPRNNSNRTPTRQSYHKDSHQTFKDEYPFYPKNE